jgi:hypothetical protein
MAALDRFGRIEIRAEETENGVEHDTFWNANEDPGGFD